MSKNVIVNGTTYNGVNNVKLPQEGGGYATFADASSSSAQWQEIYSNTISEAIHTVEITPDSDFNSCKAYIVSFSNITLSASDWLRLQLNNTSTTGNGGVYVNGSTKFTNLTSNLTFLGTKYNDTFYNVYRSNGILSSTNLTKINIFPTVSDVMITGGTIKIYGLK